MVPLNGSDRAVDSRRVSSPSVIDVSSRTLPVFNADWTNSLTVVFISGHETKQLESLREAVGVIIRDEKARFDKERH